MDIYCFIYDEMENGSLFLYAMKENEDTRLTMNDVLVI